MLFVDAAFCNWPPWPQRAHRSHSRQSWGAWAHPRQEVDAIDRPWVLRDAERYLREPPRTITSVRAPRSAGRLHDYFSEGDYWWPNPKDTNGPYIRRDGESNPDNFVAHDVDMAVFRNFKYERYNLQARFESRNLFNMVNLNAPTSTLTSSLFGYINSASGTRGLQLRLRLTF